LAKNANEDNNIDRDEVDYVVIAYSIIATLIAINLQSVCKLNFTQVQHSYLFTSQHKTRLVAQTAIRFFLPLRRVIVPEMLPIFVGIFDTIWWVNDCVEACSSCAS